MAFDKVYIFQCLKIVTHGCVKNILYPKWMQMIIQVCESALHWKYGFGPPPEPLKSPINWGLNKYLQDDKRDKLQIICQVFIL